MLALHNETLKTIRMSDCNVKIYGSDRFFIYGLEQILTNKAFDKIDCVIPSLVIKVWTDVTVTDSIYPGATYQNTEFVVICPQQTMRVVKELPGYENAYFLNASVSIGEISWELINLLTGFGNVRVKSLGCDLYKQFYIPENKEKELIGLLLNWGDIQTIAKMLGTNDKTIYSRLRKIYNEMGVINRQELFLKIQIMFQYGFWDKKNFGI